MKEELILQASSDGCASNEPQEEANDFHQSTTAYDAARKRVTMQSFEDPRWIANSQALATQVSASLVVLYVSCEP